MLILIEDKRRALALGNLDRHNLVLEPAFICGVLGVVMGPQGNLVLLFARDVVFFGQVLRGQAHDQIAIGVGQTFPDAVGHDAVLDALAPAGVLEHIRHAAHHFNAAGDGDIHVAEHDLLGRVNNGLHARGAVAMHGHAGHFDGQPCLEHRNARQIRFVRAL